MAIYSPDLVLSKSDKEALLLLGQLALASEKDGYSNISLGDVPLSPSEASRLLSLLESFVSSKLFIEGSYFVEGMANGEADHNDRLKGLYMSWRSRRGFTNVMSNQRWREFVLRAGFNSSEDAWMWPHALQRTPIRPMQLDHFSNMEEKLAIQADLHPRVRNLIIDFIEKSIPSLREYRNHRKSIQPGLIAKLLLSFISDLADCKRGTERAPMTRQRVIAVSTIIMDTAALFATRDWTATGVLSTLAAAIPDAVNYSDK